MFGVTTPCVTAIADQLRSTYDCMVFHATGTGGRSMEKLADSGLLSDWTQTRPQQQAEPGNPSPPSSSQAPWGPAEYT